MKWVVFLTPLAVALAGCSGDEDPQAPIPDDVVADALEQAFDLVGATPEQEAAIRANVDVDQDPDDGSKLGKRSGTTIVLYSDAIQALVQPPNVATLTGCLGVILAHEILHLDPGICGGGNRVRCTWRIPNGRAYLRPRRSPTLDLYSALRQGG